MKQLLLVACTVTLFASSVSAQAISQSDQPSWKRYTVKNEQFSVTLPAPPLMDYGRRQTDSRGDHLEITLSSFADGVVYIVHVVENLSPRQSLDSFITDSASSSYPLNRKTKREIKVDGVSGKTFSFNGIAGAAQFHSKDDRLFRFAAFGAPPEDERVTKFLSSISLINNKDDIEVPITTPFPYSWDPPSTSDAPEQIFTPQQVDKKFQVIMNFHPDYTELARQNRIKGTVILKCTLAANGTVRNIKVVSGLPYGLTDKAIASVRKLKFIPAMKDGKYVSVSTQLIYNFDLF